MMRHTLRVILVMAFPVLLFSQDAGKIAGTVTDEVTGEPLVGANILIEGTSFGAATDTDGNYRVLGIPVSAYAVRAEFIGYRTVRLLNVRVNPGLTTTANFTLSSQALEAGVIEVVAQRPLVNMSSTNAIRSVDSDQIANLATRDVTEFFNLQAGVVVTRGRISVRGSRPSEVGYELEGAPTRGLAIVEGSGVIQGGFSPVAVGGGGASVWNLSPTIPEALEQITMQSGGYSADLGGANAGIIQQKLKTGGSKFSGSVLMETDGLAASFDSFMPNGGTYDYGNREFTGTLGGPITSKIRFFGAYQMLSTDDYAPQWWTGGSISNGDTLTVTDPTGAATGDGLVLTWDDGKVNGRKSERNVFNGTLLLDFNPLVLRLGLATSSSSTHLVGNGIPTMFNLERQPQQDDESRLINLKGTYFLSKSTMVNFNVNNFHYYRHRYDPVFGIPDDLQDVLLWGDSAAVADKNIAIPAGLITDESTFASYASASKEDESFIVEEFQFQRTGTITSSWRKDLQDYVGFSAGLVSQRNAHEIKAGFDYRRYTIRRYSLAAGRIPSINGAIGAGIISAANLEAKTAGAAAFMRQQRVRAIGYDEFGDELDDGIFGARHPSNTALYINDKIELSDIVVNFGVRYDLMALDDATWTDPDNPAYNADLFGVYEDKMEASEAKGVLQPRLGLAFPLSDQSVFHLQYGKFAQFPELATTYKGAGAIASVFGGQNYMRDPVAFDLDPIVTNQFEVGFSYEFFDGAAFDVTAFTRNTVGQLTLAWMNYGDNSYEVAPYTAVYVNGDFTSATGLEFSLVTRRLNRLQAMVNYTWTDARGTNSYPNDMAGTLNFQNVPVPTMINPLAYQLKHKGTVNLDYRFGANEGGLLANAGLNLLFSFNSGHPFTHVDGGFGQRGADEGALLATDTRQRIPMEPVGNSTTPWVFNTDLRIGKGIAVGGISLDAYVLVTNLFNRQHVLDVYGRTGNAYDDGFLNTPELSEVLLNNHTALYRELYEVVNLENRSHYRRDMGADLFGTPRQIKVGLGLNF